MFWASLVCFLIAFLGIETMNYFMAAFFGGIGVLLMYLWATKDKRKIDEQKRIRNQKIEDGKSRFGNSQLVRTAISECKANGNQNFSCDVCFDSIKTPITTHFYGDSGLAKLDKKGCELLAYYIGSQVNNDNFIVTTKTKLVGGVSGSYSGYVGADGSISISQDCSADDVLIGYTVYARAPQPVEPPKQAW